MDLADRYRGALLGLAAGDALGTTLEFKRPGTFEPISDMTGGGPFMLRAGEWTDDTSMALCLADSLIECRRFNPTDQLERYLRWYEQGYLSSNGRCFDIGRTVHAALMRFKKERIPYPGPVDPMSAGNGSIMRLAAVPMVYAKSAGQAVERSGESSRTTHGSRAAIDACRYLGGLIAGALSGAGKQELLSPMYAPAEGLWKEQPLAPEIEAIALGSFRERNPPAINGAGYVVSTLEAALWAFARTGSFREGALRVVNLGLDADTTGAVFGQFAGAFYGESGIPKDWLLRLAYRDMIGMMAEDLLKLSEEI